MRSRDLALPIADLHVDTALHGRPLDSRRDRAPPLRRLWRAFGDLFFPVDTRDVTLEALQRVRSGAVVFSLTTEGFPPWFRRSHQFYSRVVAGRPKAAIATPLTTLLDQAAWVWRERASHPDRLESAPTADETRRAIRRGRIAVHLGIEGAAALEPDLRDRDALAAWVAEAGDLLPAGLPLPSTAELRSSRGRAAWLRRLGVLYVSLNHLGSNDFSGSDFPLTPRRGAGLSKRGRRLVSELEGQGILIDLAHASHRAQDEIAALARLPLLVSHGVVPIGGRPARHRELLPETLQAIARTGGLFGVMLARQYLEHGDVEDVVDQIDEVAGHIGLKHVGFGSDADGFVRLVVRDIGHFEPIYAAMARRGYSHAQIAQVACGNFLALLKRRAAAL